MSSNSASSPSAPGLSPRFQPCSEDGTSRKTRPVAAAPASRQVRHAAGRDSGCRGSSRRREPHAASPGSTKSRRAITGIQTPPSTQSYQEDHGRAALEDYIHIDDHDSSHTSPFRYHSDAHNEAGTSRLLRSSGSLRPHSSFQAHQIRHAGAACNSPHRHLTRLPFAQVSLPSHLTTASPPLPCSPPFTPPRKRSSPRVAHAQSCAFLSHTTSVSSLSTLASPAFALDSPFDAPSTPSPSPRLQRRWPDRSVILASCIRMPVSILYIVPARINYAHEPYPLRRPGFDRPGAGPDASKCFDTEACCPWARASPPFLFLGLSPFHRSFAFPPSSLYIYDPPFSFDAASISPHTHLISHRSTSPPPTLVLQRAIIVHRARPTLAMSVQVHAPSPIMSGRSLSPPPFVPSHSARTRSRSRRPRSPSRPTSPLAQPAQLSTPQRPPMRPPSRSERLLRDTLRRAEEHERMLSVHPLPSPTFAPSPLPSSPFLSPTGVLALPSNGGVPVATSGSRRHSRKNTSSSIATNASYDAYEFGDAPADQESTSDDMEENEDWRGQSSSSFVYQYQGTPTQAGLSRNRSMTHASRRSDRTSAHSDTNTKAQIAYGTPASPSPARMQLQRSITSTPVANRTLSSSNSQPSAAANTHMHSNSRASADGERSCSCGQNAGLITPHEAVLRSRLEGVLRGAKEQERRRRHPDSSSSGSGTGSGNSMASSRNMSAESDLFFGASGDSSVTSLSSSEYKSISDAAGTKSLASSSTSRPPPTTLNFPTRSPPSSNAVLRSPNTPSKQLGSPSSSHNGLSPLTPPPTPPFNARTAAELCRTMDGYVSFANIEGLGVPEGEEDDTDEDGKSRGRWWEWLTMTTKSRGRSESASSIASR
ncbi:uncharacterized protein FIBRA_00184 [Fibroporia radiculosa]|uniref:Uncharacterized protein n=1 Tax=Fibroporia radiculosa TaxID=599839 RepID=J7RV43_9APHY|nr:uncharacterized protein FIBRA_00184 [Fibroporia radiculosa]CCL98190.1 predicted protein [Fibroporia radiculosa]